ncbi:Txe/YoeB family addiction module toxin [Kitasatospora sp. YST-16]|uniref:Txe/YoeB family addiction module toxin n=1 Tax=Kitasatospora sp. YST-16 TaxID=2998080 RepID=UPI0022843147|nr:Txe/YoeB family addiction module toxin [Kitasatospora sp. YST-16]WAL72686.1 Txe/YoeB family addiction module toxin [Kitasatospora sp. YST-16]WNW38734.1 Txe/YoeB family addiction module toxin [Streptomyces sp. Li-HN-5-13]
MKVRFTEHGWADYLSWQADDRRLLKRVNLLIDDIRRNGNEGIGKPEPLRHELADAWSRRIDQEHRLIYVLDEQADTLCVIACRYHYGK